MSIYRVEARTRLVALLKTIPGVSALVYSSPPANLRGQIVIVGDIAFDAPEGKTSPGGWCNANVEVWSQTFSPAEVDALADKIVKAMVGKDMTGGGRSFSLIDFFGEQVIPPPQAEAGGPVFGRILAFRFYVQ